MARSKTVSPHAFPVGAARKPAQERSRVRFQTLLDATADLLAKKDFSEVGLYDIAERAHVPPASVYHFFPTKEAAFLALAERYLVELQRRVNAPVDPSRIQNWPDLLNLRFDRAVEYFNRNGAFGRLFLGGSVISEIRRMDVDHVAASANSIYAGLDRYFVMPYLPAHQLKFSVLIAIHDGVWMTSYARHGTITEEFANEARTAAMAYCRTFLPEVLPCRAPRAESHIKA